MSYIGAIKATKEAMMWIATISMCFGVIVIGIALILVASIHPAADTAMFCTQEAKICPDGSGVGRTGPNCEFAACPGVSECLAGAHAMCTRDIRELCSPDGIWRKAVAGSCSCGEDAVTLERLGWEVCTDDRASRTDEQICGPQPPVDCAPGNVLRCSEESKWQCLPEMMDLDTSDWKTYRSEEYGFEVKYPARWAHLEINSSNFLKIELSDTDKQYYFEGHAVPPISVLIVTDAKDSFTQTLAMRKKQGVIPMSFRIGDLDTYKFSNYNGTEVYVVQGQGEAVYIFSMPNVEENTGKLNQIYETILGTVRFF